MRKIRILFITLVLFFTTLCLTSCKNNNLNYEICGLYIELIDVGTMSIEDNNPKIYFKKDDNNILATKTGQVGKVVYFMGTSKVVEPENGKYVFFTSFSVPEETYDKINIRVIIYQNGKYIIDKKAYKTIKKEGTCQYVSDYTYKNNEYHVQFQLKIVTRE